MELDLEPRSRAQITSTNVTQALAKRSLPSSFTSSSTVPPWMSEHEKVEEYEEKLHLCLTSWEQDCTKFKSSNEIFNTMLGTSLLDFYSLQIPEGPNKTIAPACPGLPHSLAGLPHFLLSAIGLEPLVGTRHTEIPGSAPGTGGVRR